ncbi:MAG: LuxR C-terminal-related transcriptional regulator [Thermoleophilia bacterium]
MPAQDLRSGDPLFATDRTLQIVVWNTAAEELTGIPAEEAIGRPCWQVICGHDDRGALTCHADCAGARDALAGWPVRRRALWIKTSSGRRRVALSTVVVPDEPGPLIVHLLDDADPGAQPSPPPGPRPMLSPRQLEVLRLLADGLTAKQVAHRLTLAMPTVRNHIRGILTELGAHSQLEALAAARRWGLL